MRITLTPALAKIVKKQLSTGRYRTARAVVSDALKLLQQHYRSDAAKLADLRREIAIGIDQADRGECIEFDDDLVEEICRAGRERLKRRTNRA